MKKVSHPRIVHVHEVLASQSKVFIVLDLVTGGSLAQLVAKNGRLEEGVAKMYFQQLVEGVAHCHEVGVAHRNLKLDNLLLDGEGNVKLAGFGQSTMHGTDSPSGSPGGPSGMTTYAEQDAGCNFSADVWSCGVILFLLLGGA